MIKLKYIFKRLLGNGRRWVFWGAISAVCVIFAAPLLIKVGHISIYELLSYFSDGDLLLAKPPIEDTSTLSETARNYLLALAALIALPLAIYRVFAFGYISFTEYRIII